MISKDATTGVGSVRYLLDDTVTFENVNIETGNTKEETTVEQMMAKHQ